MRIGNLSGRLVLLSTAGSVDVYTASGGRFGPDPQSVFDVWPDFAAWAASPGDVTPTPYDESRLGPPTPAPRQIFAVGLNYTDHAREAGFAVPENGPARLHQVRLLPRGSPRGRDAPPGWPYRLGGRARVVDRPAREAVAPAAAWSYVAGLMVGQDLSERRSQMAGPSPAVQSAKSFPGFGPIGPALVTTDEFDDPDDLALSAILNGEKVQEARTSQLIFDVPSIVAKLSAVARLLPGDIIFTGTPSGVGMGRNPQRWLAPGDELTSTIEGIGQLRQRFVAAPATSESQTWLR